MDPIKRSRFGYSYIMSYITERIDACCISLRCWNIGEFPAVEVVFCEQQVFDNNDPAPVLHYGPAHYYMAESRARQVPLFSNDTDSLTGEHVNVTKATAPNRWWWCNMKIKSLLHGSRPLSKIVKLKKFKILSHFRIVSFENLDIESSLWSAMQTLATDYKM